MYSWERAKVIKDASLAFAGLLIMNNWLGTPGVLLWCAGVWVWERIR